MTVIVPEWAREDPDLFRHALNFERELKEQARLEEEARRHREFLGKVQAMIARQLEKYVHGPLTPQTVQSMEVDARRVVRELEIRAGIPEEQSVAGEVTLQHHLGEFTITVPQFPPSIMLKFEIGDVEEGPTEK